MELVEIKNVTETEVLAETPKTAELEFRQRVSPETLEKIQSQAPKLALDMIRDPLVAINFGQDVVQSLNNLSVRLLKEQENTTIPEADAIVNNVLREIDGYSAKYKYKEPGAVAKFFSKLGKRGKETMYDLKAMVRDAKPIADRLLEAEGKIQKMELDIDANIVKSQQLREATLKVIDDVAIVIALFEEIIDRTKEEVIKVQEVLLEAERNNSSVVEFKGKTYSIEEFREVLADFVSAENEIEKTWFNWRQKFFLYLINIASTREIINTSISLKRTANRVRVDAIPAGRTQLAAWQQAARMEETAVMVDKANEGIEKLIVGASRGQLSAIEKAAEANKRVMLSEETILELTDNLQKQFETIVQAELEGREVRAKNLEILRQSEQAIVSASADAQAKLISQSINKFDNALSDQEETPREITGTGDLSSFR